MKHLESPDPVTNLAVELFVVMVRTSTLHTWPYRQIIWKESPVPHAFVLLPSLPISSLPVPSLPPSHRVDEEA